MKFKFRMYSKVQIKTTKQLGRVVVQCMRFNGIWYAVHLGDDSFEWYHQNQIIVNNPLYKKNDSQVLIFKDKSNRF
jgi:N-formylglutamate amidohydrolase